MKGKEQEFVIKYKAAPRWVIDLFWLLCVTCAALALILFFQIQDELIANGLHLLFGSVFLFIVALAVMMQQNCIYLKPEGILFPAHMMPSLRFQRARRWSDIGAVMLVDDEGPDYFETAEYESKELVIHFNSGGNVRLSLAAVAMSDLDKFFKASKQWGSTAVFAPELIELKRKLFTGPSQTKQISFTTIWEEEMQAHFTTTNFVPLDRGKLLQSGKFKIVSQLTAGGLSAIYLAERSDKRTVVLKEAVVPPYADDKTRAKAKELFDREARFLVRLDHPRIARVFDHFVEDGRDYLVIEYIPGQSLRQLVIRNGVQSEDKVLEWAQETAGILDYLHLQEPPLIHRDLSPDNLLLREDGALFLIDFGAANEFIGTATGTLIGKQSYIAPEQFRGKALPLSDIYGLGGTMHFLLTGMDPEALSVSHPREQRPTVSLEVDALVAECTQTEAEKRMQSAKELGKRLDALRKSDRQVVLKMPGAPGSAPP